jgi:DNA-binding IclR family transcriptional regulator
MAGDETAAESEYRIGALANAFDIVHELERLGGGGVSEVAANLDVPKSTAHVYMKSLYELGYLVKEGSTYYVSLRFLERGGARRKSLDVFEVARHEVDDLARRTGEVAHLGVEERGQRVLVYSSGYGEGIFDNSPVGQFTRMHWTALGKSLLAFRSDERIREIVDEHGLPENTEHTITDVDELFEEVRTIRERGYAVGDEEHRDGIRSVAVPITDGSDSVALAAVGVAGPRSVLTEETISGDLLDTLRETKNVIELKHEHYTP